MFRKFQISNPLPNRYFPKIDVGGPCFYHDQSTYQIKKNVGEFFRSSINVCIEVQKKRNLSCAVIYVLIRREIAVGLIPSVQTPPSPQKKFGRESLFPIFPEERWVSVQVKQRGKSERRSGDIESTFRVGRIAFSETDIFTANKK